MKQSNIRPRAAQRENSLPGALASPFLYLFHNQRFEQKLRARWCFFPDGKVARNELEITFVSDTEICCVPARAALFLSRTSLERPSNYGTVRNQYISPASSQFMRLSVHVTLFNGLDFYSAARNYAKWGEQT